MALPLGWAQGKLWRGMPGTWDGAGRKSDAPSLAYAQLGAVPQARAGVPCSVGLRAREGAQVRARDFWS